MVNRWASEYCARCGNRWSQDWEDHPECPRCGYPFTDEEDEEKQEDESAD